MQFLWRMVEGVGSKTQLWLALWTASKEVGFRSPHPAMAALLT
jgi:hypothetical protein